MTVTKTAANMKGEIERRMALPYAREIIRNSDGTWFARIVELPGCMTEGGTPAEAFANLDDAMRSWIEVKLEDGDAIPEPFTTDSYSGKFLTRVPRSLHRELAQRADREGVSLNQFVLSTLSKAIGIAC